MMEGTKYRTSAPQVGATKGGILMSAEENKEVVQQFWGVWEEGNIVDSSTNC